MKCKHTWSDLHIVHCTRCDFGWHIQSKHVFITCTILNVTFGFKFCCISRTQCLPLVVDWMIFPGNHLLGTQLTGYWLGWLAPKFNTATVNQLENSRQECWCWVREDSLDQVGKAIYNWSRKHLSKNWANTLVGHGFQQWALAGGLWVRIRHPRFCSTFSITKRVSGVPIAYKSHPTLLANGWLTCLCYLQKKLVEHPVTGCEWLCISCSVCSQIYKSTHPKQWHWKSA